MEIVLWKNPVDRDNITICCRKKEKRARIVIMMVASVISSWLLYGATGAAIGSGLTFRQALFCPVVLGLIALEAIAWFFVTLKKDARKYSKR